MRQLHSNTHCCLWICHTRKQSNSLAVSSMSKKVGTRHKSVLRAVLERMQFTLHATRRTPRGASRLVQATSAWLVKTRRAPSLHSRHVGVYGLTTTAKHKLSTPLPLPPFPLPSPTPLDFYFMGCFPSFYLVPRFFFYAPPSW